MNFTPMIKQYLQIKEQYPDAVLFFRLGDFYEMFFEDAHLASRELEITLTGRDAGGSERVPMCGVPYHAAESYIARLIDKGYRVAICEQVEDPAAAKGIVKREVVRVVTPGTVMESQLLEDKNNNYLASVVPGKDGFGLAVADISTGSFLVTCFSGAGARLGLTEELARLRPAELLVPRSEVEALNSMLKLAEMPLISGYCEAAFARDEAGQALARQFGAAFGEKQRIFASESMVAAAGSLLSYLRETQKRELAHLNKIQFYQTGRYMVLDEATRRNLELTKGIMSRSRKNTLLDVLDHTVTAMGGRLIRSWIEQPLLDRDEIESRLEAVGELVDSVFLRRDLQDGLKNIYDLERLVGRISFGTANARDLIALKKSLVHLPGLKSLLEQAGAALLRKTGHDIDLIADVLALLEEAIEEDPPLSLRDGGIIKVGYNHEVDRLRTAGRDGKIMLAALEERERARTGIKSLKVGFNKVFGYYIEVTKSNLHLVPEDFQRRQTLANAERYITPELKEYEDMVLGAGERLVQLEYHLFQEIREKVSAGIGRIQRTAAAIARGDALVSLAEAAVRGGYTRPVINSEGEINIRDGRHPVLENVLNAGQFVSNDTVMDDRESRLFLITGPNMAGKSTYMRQVALIVLMAQTGSFVPAAYTGTCLVDRIFTRVGAADDLSGGQSTFMVEMNECRAIVAGATNRSLIIMDEVGRGTSTYDGISIARALVEYIHLRIGAKTLFSTHYHELTDLERLPGIVNYNVAVKEVGEDIIFLRKVIPGKADRSYGIHVARLAGLPEEILNRSAEVLKSLEPVQESSRQLAAAMEYAFNPLTQDNLKVAEDSFQGNNSVPGAGGCYSINMADHPVLKELRSLDLQNMTPLEAINKLDQFQKSLANQDPK
ncbi:MAG: DNA mismatch repair protein MutS [Pelotomaculum sp. PtaB.Bin104]|nr:MAG: DNA mismatch repair protein MutS [Pelotomaculum sp. PtaB.Bin104]